MRKVKRDGGRENSESVKIDSGEVKDKAGGNTASHGENESWREREWGREREREKGGERERGKEVSGMR